MTSRTSCPSAAVGHHLDNARFEDLYELGEEIGVGGFSVVHVVTERATGRNYACKVVTLRPTTHVVRSSSVVGVGPSSGTTFQEDLVNEVKIQGSLKHDGIASLKEAFIEGGEGLLSLPAELRIRHARSARNASLSSSSALIVFGLPGHIPMRG